MYQLGTLQVPTRPHKQTTRTRVDFSRRISEYPRSNHDMDLGRAQPRIYAYTAPKVDTKKIKINRCRLPEDFFPISDSKGRRAHFKVGSLEIISDPQSRPASPCIRSEHVLAPGNQTSYFGFNSSKTSLGKPRKNNFDDELSNLVKTEIVRKSGPRNKDILNIYPSTVELRPQIIDSARLQNTPNPSRMMRPPAISSMLLDSNESTPPRRAVQNGSFTDRSTNLNRHTPSQDEFQITFYNNHRQINLPLI